MKFKEFLAELEDKPFTQAISNDKAIEWIKNNSSQYTSGRRLLYRGMPATLEPHFGDSRGFKRKSKNTDNYYTMIMDSSPAWKEFPPRSSSFICSSSEDTASSYSSLFAVFPEDDADVGLCPGDDLWHSFHSLNNFHISGLRRFNDFLNALANFRDVKFTTQDPAIFREQLKWFDLKNLEKISVEGGVGASPFDQEDGNSKDYLKARRFEKEFGLPLAYLIMYMQQHKLPDLEKTFEKILDPDDFIACKAKDLKLHLEFDSEAWFSGRAIFIPAKELNSKSSFGQQFKAEFGWL